MKWLKHDMTIAEFPISDRADAAPTLTELSEALLGYVAGGLNPQPLPPGMEQV